MTGASTSAALYALVTSPATRKAVPEEAADRKHHLENGAGFQNPWNSWSEEMTGPQIMRAMISRRFSGKHPLPKTSPPTVTVKTPSFLPTRETRKLRATWLGHACYYIEFPSGLRILFDPVFTDRCSPVSFMGPKRYTEAPCKIEDIPFVDACVISHAHYDHLSVEAVQQIQKKWPNVHFFAPLGNKKWFTASGIPNMTELDWWEDREMRLSPKSGDTSTATLVQPVSGTSDELNKSVADEIVASISCLPAQHASARTPFDKNCALWASWSVSSGSQSVYFGGDTGYRSIPASVPEEAGMTYTPEIHRKYPACPAFKQIGKLRGPFDLGLIPIGAYKPRFLFSPMHANPFDAVAIFRDVNVKKAMGIHWGTWVLTEEDVLEPPRLLKVALKSKGLPEEGLFDVCDIGESREFERSEELSESTTTGASNLVDQVIPLRCGN